MKRTLLHIHYTIWITFIFFLMLAAVFFSAARLATPWMVQQKPLLEKWAGTLLDQPVQIEQLTINWQGFEPTLKCQQVIILNDDRTEPLLQVHELDIGVSFFRSIFSGHLRLGHLRIDGLHLTVNQTANGLAINGINTALTNGAAKQTNNDTLKDILEWLFSEPEISLRDVTLTWYDPQQKVIPITGLDFIIKNRGDKHNIAGQATLAQTTPTQLNFVIKVEGDWRAQNRLHAMLYLKAHDILLAQWINRLAIKNLQVKKGLANIELWGQWRHQQWLSWQSLFAVNNVVLQYPLALKTSEQNTAAVIPVSTIALKHLSGNVSWQPQKDGGWQLNGNQLRVQFDKTLWPAMQFSVQMNADQSKQSWQFSYINLTEVTNELLRLKLLPVNWQTTLTQLQPQGELQNAELQYQINSAGNQYIFTSGFTHLTANRWHSVPGINNLTGTIRLEPEQGNLMLTSQQSRLDFGKLFRAPIRLNQLTAQASWQHTPKGWAIKANKLQANNADFALKGQCYLNLPDNNASPYLSLLAGYQLKNAQHIENYLPLTELSSDLVKWLSTAIVSFAKAQGTLVINGDLADYPFDNNKGTFIVDSDIEDADLAYWPKWPQLKHFSGELIFTGPSMQVTAKSGEILNTQIKQLTASIASLKKGVPSVLQINSQLEGDLADGVRILRDSPLNKIQSGADIWQARGPLQLQLGLTIPLENNDPVKVNGVLNTQKAEFSIPKWNLTMPDLQGQLKFTEQSLNAQQMIATLWQKPVIINIRTLAKNAGMVIALAGQVNMKDVQQNFNTSLLNSLTGTGNYTVLVNIADEEANSNLQINTDLKGIAIDLPAPLAKTAEQNIPLRFIANLGGNQPFTKFQLNYGTLVANINKRTTSWLLNINSPDAVGSINLPTQKNAVINANFQSLILTDDNTSHASHLQPQDVPNLNFSCQNLQYGNKNFGAIKFRVTPITNGVIINNLQANSNAFNLAAQGKWLVENKTDWTTLSGTLTSPNIADALASWGMPAGFTSKTTTINFALRWPGAPYDPSLAIVKGTLGLNIKDGVLSDVGADSQVKMNIGRMITFLSWQSIARRLHLDFSDLTKKGFSFNILKGDFALTNGNATTRNTYLDGPVAKITVSGRIGLVAEDFDLQLGVSPHLSTGLTVVAGLAGGPVVGLATGAASWIANKIISKEMDTYHMTGPWSKPEVTHENNILNPLMKRFKH